MRSSVARELARTPPIVVCLSGRGDKDMHTAAEWFDLVDEAASGPPRHRAAGDGDAGEAHR